MDIRNNGRFWLGRRRGIRLEVDGLGGGGDAYFRKVTSLPTAGNLIAYQPFSEGSGAVAVDYSGQANHGAYTGVTLGYPGIGDGRTCPLFDGVNDYVNDYSAALASDFTPDLFTLCLWAKMFDAGVWTDATTRRLWRWAADGSNLANIVRQSSNNGLQFGITYGGTAKTINTTAFGGVTDWLFLALTVDKAGDAFKAYGCVKGAALAQIGTAQTGLGTWAGALAATATVTGAFNTTPTNPSYGYIAHRQVYNAALTLAQLAPLAAI